MPEGTWYCSSCNDGPISSKKATTTDPSGNARPIVIRLSRVVKAPESDIGGCVFCRLVAILITVHDVESRCGLLLFL